MAQPLKPTLREKKRYVVYEPADDSAVLHAFSELFGIHGLSQAGMLPVTRSGKKSIIRVRHNDVQRLKAALLWAKKRSLHTSGTLKTAKAKLE